MMVYFSYERCSNTYIGSMFLILRPFLLLSELSTAEVVIARPINTFKYIYDTKVYATGANLSTPSIGVNCKDT